jgi:hypothetical protein
MAHCFAIFITVFLTLVFFEPGTSAVLPSGPFISGMDLKHSQNLKVAPRNATTIAFAFPKQIPAPARMEIMARCVL